MARTEAVNVIFVVGSRPALEYILDNHVMAFRSSVKTDMLEKGMRFALYTTRGAYGNPTKDRSQILALGRLSSGVTGQAHSIDQELFPQSCRLKFELRLPWRKGLIFDPLVDELAFVGGRRRYASVFHRTIVKVPTDDYELITSVFKAKVKANNKLKRTSSKNL